MTTPHIRLALALFILAACGTGRSPSNESSPPPPEAQKPEAAKPEAPKPEVLAGVSGRAIILPASAA